MKYEPKVLDYLYYQIPCLKRESSEFLAEDDGEDLSKVEKRHIISVGLILAAICAIGIISIFMVKL